MQTFSDVIDELGGYSKVADALGLPKGTVSAMKTRNSIPAEYWPQIVSLAEGHVPGVTIEVLAGMSRPRQRRSSPEALAS